MYITLADLDAVRDFAAARLVEQSRALADALGEDHPSLDLARALDAALRAAAGGVTDLVHLQQGATDTRETVSVGLAGTGWGTLVAAARQWRTHSDYPDVADRDFTDFVNGAVRAAAR
ncbi:hypothetical protein ACIRVF_39340 [Kitasatospora sp. NPDC101157]|uniref:hypothetical protein n=1 Tax=Kitasatospora sp. NPDC101157 TaxID=3364098 RepID=UPI0038038CE9